MYLIKDTNCIWAITITKLQVPQLKIILKIYTINLEQPFGHLTHFKLLAKELAWDSALSRIVSLELSFLSSVLVPIPGREKEKHIMPIFYQAMRSVNNYTFLF